MLQKIIYLAYLQSIRLSFDIYASQMLFISWVVRVYMIVECIVFLCNIIQYAEQLVLNKKNVCWYYILLIIVPIVGTPRSVSLLLLERSETDQVSEDALYQTFTCSLTLSQQNFFKLQHFGNKKSLQHFFSYLVLVPIQSNMATVNTLIMNSCLQQSQISSLI